MSTMVRGWKQVFCRPPNNVRKFQRKRKHSFCTHEFGYTVESGIRKKHINLSWPRANASYFVRKIWTTTFHEERKLNLQRHAKQKIRPHTSALARTHIRIKSPQRQTSLSHHNNKRNKKLKKKKNVKHLSKEQPPTFSSSEQQAHSAVYRYKRKKNEEKNTRARNAS